MKQIRLLGLALFVIAMITFVVSITLGEYKITDSVLQETMTPAHIEAMKSELQPMMDKVYTSNISFISDFESAFDKVNAGFKKNKEWDKVIYDKYTFSITKNASQGVFVNNQWLFFMLSIGLGIIGAFMYIIPKVKTDGPAGIKNNHIFHRAATSRGWIGILVGTFMISFYILLYFQAAYITNWVLLVDPISEALNGNPASEWFLYGFLYTIAIFVMGIRMYIKYRHSPYQMVRNTSVIFFQLAFAFFIPQLLARLNKPEVDFKNMWPLDYDFFFDWNLDKLLAEGNLGLFMLIWGIALFVIGVPVFVYFFGKRWYCSWVCGCGGLAETLGDPYRQLSDKSVNAWKIERWMIHGVLVFAVVMTAGVLYTYFTGSKSVLGINTYEMRSTYGFAIGAIFSGVVGTGFYPLMGNRVWCRFGCPLAGYLGLVQRFKSKFRITTNGGQCISCGNCSTYCEMGIDVRAYAQKGQSIVRSSCVGCGVCSAVCPRGVLNLENLSDTSGTSRTELPAIIIGREKASLVE
ncbi:MAG: ferredoxin-type protein NapH [Arenicella sp.]|jgi:ferredoxin-type protein NapH